MQNKERIVAFFIPHSAFIILHFGSRRDEALARAATSPNAIGIATKKLAEFVVQVSNLALGWE